MKNSLQEVRVRLWEQLPTLAAPTASQSADQPANLRAWLYQLARHVTYSWLRRQSRKNQPLPTDADRLPAALSPGPASLIRLNVLRQGNAAWEAVSIEQLAAQQNGEAFIAAATASVPEYSTRALPARVRPTCAQPGGTTQTATGEE